MDIYMIPIELIECDLGDEFNAFTTSEWNDLKELTNYILTYLQFCKDSDLIYNPYNFMLDFNLEEEETNPEDYAMFIPDEKFNKQITDYLIR